MSSTCFVLAFLASLSGAGATEECQRARDVPLTLPDNKLTASSSSAGCFPYLGQLSKDEGCGAWCPAEEVRSSSTDWLQLDFGRMANVSFIETGGRFAGGRGGEFTRQYRLQYDRGDDRGMMWYRLGESGQTAGVPAVLNGNTDSHSSDYVRVHRLVARRLRFLPFATSPVGQVMCLRVRINGCYTDGVSSYTVIPAPQQQPWDQMSVDDVRFDGEVQLANVSGGRRILYRGLGLLTDNLLAENFQVTNAATKRGSGWVGWRQSNTHGNHENVTLLFEFDEPRNFSKIRIHTNNQFEQEVRMFRHVAIQVSMDRHPASDTSEVFLTMPDSFSEQPRNMEFMLFGGRRGRYVKLHLFFNAKWMLISEVAFDSTIINPNDWPDQTLTQSPMTTAVESEGLAVVFHTMPGDGLAEDSRLQSQQPGAGSHQLDSQTIGIIAGASAGACMLIICLVVISCLCRKHLGKHSSSAHYVDQQFVLQNGFKPERTAAAAGEGVSYSGLPAVKDGTYEEPWGHSMPQLSLTGRPLRLPCNGYTSDGAGSVSDYAIIPDVGPQAMLLPASHTLPCRPQPFLPHGGYSSTGRSMMVGCSSIQGASGSSLFGMPAREQFVDDQPILEVPFTSLHFVEKLGEGQFGEVHLCRVSVEAIGCQQALQADEGIEGVEDGDTSIALVACKVLKQDASDVARRDFQREIKILGRLRDPNIVNVLGVCKQDNQPLCVIVQYMQYGDLHQFLRRHHAPDAAAQLLRSQSPFILPRDSGCGRDAPPSYSSLNDVLSRGSLIYMASQVAAGMKYVESLNMVHRDLAARNVLVGPWFSVKIADFGMSRHLYSCDYYRVEGRVVLPIRWMAWESILLGKFTTRSDVWSFGVLLWEIFTFAREPPYRHWTDEQVIDNCVQFRSGSNMAVVLERPDYCPREVYDLMRACWNAEDHSRPLFKDIHLFLMHKNVGYDPRHDNGDARRRRGSNTRTLEDEVFMATDC